MKKSCMVRRPRRTGMKKFVVSLIIVALCMSISVHATSLQPVNEIVIGDVNIDNKISLTDAIMMFRCITEREGDGYCGNAVCTTSGDELLVGDVNFDGDINAEDLLLLLKYMEKDETAVSECGKVVEIDTDNQLAQGKVNTPNNAGQKLLIENVEYEYYANTVTFDICCYGITDGLAGLSINLNIPSDAEVEITDYTDMYTLTNTNDKFYIAVGTDDDIPLSDERLMTVTLNFPDGLDEEVNLGFLSGTALAGIDTQTEEIYEYTIDDGNLVTDGYNIPAPSTDKFTFITKEATNITSTGATLNGHYDIERGNIPAGGGVSPKFILWKKDDEENIKSYGYDSYFFTSDDISYDVTGLEPDTEYEYYLSRSDGYTDKGETIEFRTQSADGKTALHYGDCGEGVKWALYSTGELVISGTGDMTDYSSSSAPWYDIRSSIASVVVENGITSISDYAFRDCSGLTSVTIGNSVTSIGEWAFSDCSSLTSATISDSVTNIGRCAFSDCSDLLSVTIPDSVTDIGERAFSGTGYYNDSSHWENGVLYIDNCLIKANSDDIPAEYGIKSGTRVIADYAFWYCSSLTSVTIPDSVTSIGDNAFYGCSGLTSVTIPDSVISIGGWAFEGCTILESITIGNGVTSIGDGAFYDCSSLTSVTIPNSVTSIGSVAFKNCESLTSITIGNGVTSIGGWAFYDCSSLTSITIPNSVTNIGDWTFSGCSGLTSITIGNGITSISDYAFENCGSLTSITIPYSVTNIGYYAFSGCSSLTSVTIGSGITSIGGDAFVGTGYYNDSRNWEDGVLYIDNCLINANPDDIPAEYEIKNGTRVIAECAFWYCSSLTSVTIPNSVTAIGYGVFEGCESLKSVTIPNSVTSIGYCAFFDCYGLTSVTVPDSVTSIGGGAFFDCYGLTSVTIPDSVTSIGTSAFSGCDSLTDVYYGGNEKDWNNISIDSNNECLTEATIHYNTTPTPVPTPIPVTTAEIERTDEGTGTEYAFTVTPETAYENCYVYAAVYDDNGVLIAVSRVPLETAGNTSISVNKSSNDALVKVFIWADTQQSIIETAGVFPLTDIE